MSRAELYSGKSLKDASGARTGVEGGLAIAPVVIDIVFVVPDIGASDEEEIVEDDRDEGVFFPPVLCALDLL